MISYIETANIELNINNEKRNLIIRPADTLLRVLREQLGLTGAKAGCENGDCGTCTVLLDGLPVKSCIMLAVEAFIDKWSFQCGYCTPGFIMNCYGLVTIHPDADDETIEEWLQSNICRCTGYEEIREAVKSVLVLKQK